MFSSIVGHCTKCWSTLIPTEVTQVAPPHVVCFRVSHFSSGCSLFKLNSDDGQPSARSTPQSIFQRHFRLSGHHHHHNGDDDDDDDDDGDDDYPPNEANVRSRGSPSADNRHKSAQPCLSTMCACVSTMQYVHFVTL